MKSISQDNQARLAAAMAAMADWRNNKASSSESIPDEIWQQIFALEDTFSYSQLKSVFSISTNQYTNKRMKIMGPQSNSDAATPSATVPPNAKMDFCEVKLKPDSVTSAVPKATLSTPSPYALEALPQAKTLIVEFCRQDGVIMKLHTTQDSIAMVMQNFFEGVA